MPALDRGARSGSLDHPALGRVRYSLEEVADDPDTQVAQVIGLMRGYAATDARSPEIRSDAHQLLAQYGDPVDGVFQFVRSRMGFIEDERTAAPLQTSQALPIVETLVRPRDMSILTSQVGDCDDYAMYGASLLEALDVPSAFVTVAADPSTPEVYSHVYLAAYPTAGRYQGSRVPLDLSHGAIPGWEFHPEVRLKRKEWPLSGGSCTALGWALAAALAYSVYATLRSKGVN